jgi:hypothetical protein
MLVIRAWIQSRSLVKPLDLAHLSIYAIRKIFELLLEHLFFMSVSSSGSLAPEALSFFLLGQVFARCPNPPQYRHRPSAIRVAFSSAVICLPEDRSIGAGP